MTVMTEIRKRSTTESVLKAFAKSKAVKTLAKSFAQSSFNVINQSQDNMCMSLAREVHGYGKNSVKMTITKTDYFYESKIKFIFQYNLFGMVLADVSYTGTISNEMMDEAATFVKGQLW